MKASKSIWLTRDTTQGGSPAEARYDLHHAKLSPTDRDEGMWPEGFVTLSSKEWHSIGDASTRLRPGGGPIELAQPTRKVPADAS